MSVKRKFEEMKYVFWCNKCEKWDSDPKSFAGNDKEFYHHCNFGRGMPGPKPNFDEDEFLGIYCLSCKQTLDDSCFDEKSGLVWHECPWRKEREDY